MKDVLILSGVVCLSALVSGFAHSVWRDYKARKNRPIKQIQVILYRAPDGTPMMDVARQDDRANLFVWAWWQDAQGHEIEIVRE